MPAHASPSTSDWPSLNFDAAQSNNNLDEKALNSRNILKLKVRWFASIADASYPVIAGGNAYLPVVAHGKIHVRVLDALSGKSVALYPKDALGGMLVNNGSVYLAGRNLQAVDAAGGAKVTTISASPALSHGSFVYPISDDKVIIAGYASTKGRAPNTLYAINPQSNNVMWKAPSLDALGAIGAGRVLTQTATGSAFYAEGDGHATAAPRSVYSDWFGNDSLAYTVASIAVANVKRRHATLYAYFPSGVLGWKRRVGPNMVAAGWPHAVTPDRLYIQTLLPQSGVSCLNATNGHQIWFRQIADIQRIVHVNSMVLVLTYGLGQQVRLLAFQAKSGKSIGAVVLSPGYYAFPEPNELMVADGMVFIRVEGAKGSQLLALGP